LQRENKLIAAGSPFTGGSVNCRVTPDAAIT
jgi:hypothetical protein